jgi:hypothetical protein
LPDAPTMQTLSSSMPSILVVHDLNLADIGDFA